jgi:hypothetical protein
MTAKLDTLTAHRFARTVRVTLGTALAEYDLTDGRARAASASVFRALAAKSRDAWAFPAMGVISRDGLVLAELERSLDGTPARLILQAQGSAGLSVFAGRSASLTLKVGTLRGSFDRDGRFAVDLHGLDVTDDDLAAFELRREDEGP